MSSRQAKTGSVASQLVLRFTLTAALLLSCGLGIFYWIVIQHAFAEDNVVLADKVTALQEDFAEGGPRAFAEEIDSHQGGHTPYWIRVLDSTGKTTAETPGMSELIPIEAFPLAAELYRGSKDYRINHKMFSLVAFSEKSGGDKYTIQIAQDRSSDENLEIEVGALLMLVLAGGIIAAALIAITVTRRGLHPLAEMTNSVEQIGPTHLDARVAPAGWPRELQPLANAFDQMLERLEQSFTRLSQFSADLAHELRTPIANILGEAQVALTRDRPPAEYREVIASMITECERLSGIVDNLLFVARADAAREPIEKKLFDGRAAAEKMANFYRTLAEDRHITINCTGKGKIFADPILFERAVSNLVDNALRFTADGGKIEISIASEADNSKILVTDNGCGIAPEHLPRVFDRFYRADSSRSSHGTGLGLALVKSIVDLHGGAAKIDSEVGHGTTVVLIFPQPAGLRA